MNVNARILNKTLQAIEEHFKKIINHDQIDFIPDVNGWFIIYKLVNAIYHISRLRDKNHMIISLDTKMMFDKI